MKALMLVYNPFTHDPRVYNEAKSLVGAGYKVTVIAFDREGQNQPRQSWDGIQIVRLRSPLKGKTGAGLARWVWSGLVLLLWQWQAYRQALKLHRDDAFDVIHCHDFDTLPAGVWLKQRLGLPLIYDAHEIYA